jgi:predicted lipid carrier protein YhbT
VVRYLSDEWFDEAGRLLGDHPPRSDREDAFVIQQVVDDGPATEPVTWHIAVAGGAARLARGVHDRPDITLTCDLTTAWEVHQGRTSAQAAFMAGRLRLGGDASALLANRDALAALDDRLAPLRARTGP